VRRSDFAYDLPPELIAQEPLAERSASRLLVLGPDSRAPDPRAPDPRAPDAHGYRDAYMRDLPDLLSPGDLLVFNDTKVIAARLGGTKPTGGRVELFLERPIDADRALVQVRASKPIRPGMAIETAGGTVRVLEQCGELWEVSLPQAALAFFERWGEVPLPPYIRRRPNAADRERYQSVFARAEGAVAAPTASLHFDPPLLEALERRGIGRAFITLHVGAGTFQPVRAEDLHSHVMHAERVSVSAATWEAIARARARAGRIIAVGTTVVRALESAALESAGLEPVAWSGETRLFITPGFRFRVTEGLITNFHLPESTLLMLVSALAGRERVLAAYAHAVRSRYRFFSYGDAMLVVPAGRSGPPDGALAPAHAAAV
jgi:S-adenosylmethionine:tRNA ribosyltransferase-isomerase